MRRRDQRPYNVAYYATHREQELERVRLRQREAVEFLRRLRCVPCADCGGEFPPYVMDFDHRGDARKDFWILQRAGAVSRERLMTEIAKCDVVCANCHRARTHARALERRRLRNEEGRAPRTESRPRREQTALLQVLRDAPVPIAVIAFPSSPWSSIIAIRPLRSSNYRGCWVVSVPQSFFWRRTSAISFVRTVTVNGRTNTGSHSAGVL